MITKILLSPFALIYGTIATIRNKCFDCGILYSKKYNKPVICVGNITVGGTGKTPHIEYLVTLLAKHNKVAVVSRGYGRKTKGFVVVEPQSPATDVGDEPLQIKRKFPSAIVAVDEKRVHGIDTLDALHNPDIFLLDDAFQHRHVDAGMNIVLVDYNRPLFTDMMLPAGRLREPKSNIVRANIVIVTKCPPHLTIDEQKAFANRLKLTTKQQIYFTTFRYTKLQPLFDSQPIENIHGVQIVVATGISQPQRMYNYLESNGATLHKVEFADHHFFNYNDIEKIKSTYNDIQAKPKIVVITEKDAARLNTSMLDALSEHPIYTLPIEVEFLSNPTDFNETIYNFAK